MKSIAFVGRIVLAWFGALMFGVILYESLIGKGPGWIRFLIVLGTLIVVVTRAISHVRRVRLIAPDADETALGSRHRRRVEIPFPPSDAFDIVEAAIRELPYVQNVESARDSLQIHARVLRRDPYVGGGGKKKDEDDDDDGSGDRKNLVHATIAPGERTGSLTLICEPEGGPWVDWFMVDDGTNYENAEAITRAIARRISERRKVEEAEARESATGKELAVAKLNLLHAQVEPHFLYNTLASAQILTRTDPARAEQMLGNLIVYLRTSIPRAEDSLSRLGEELERARAYLEILKIRMGERLALEIQVPDALKSVPVPPMMLQTLVENAIKHGLEPIPGGGTIWVIAREADGKVAVTVADDGRGFSEDGGGTGIGLKNVRERLRLLYGDAASLSITGNFPKGVAATITLPRAVPTPPGENRSEAHA